MEQSILTQLVILFSINFRILRMLKKPLTVNIDLKVFVSNMTLPSKLILLITIFRTQIYSNKVIVLLVKFCHFWCKRASLKRHCRKKNWSYHKPSPNNVVPCYDLIAFQDFYKFVALCDQAYS